MPSRKHQTASPTLPPLALLPPLDSSMNFPAGGSRVRLARQGAKTSVGGGVDCDACPHGVVVQYVWTSWTRWTRDRCGRVLGHAAEYLATSTTEAPKASLLSLGSAKSRLSRPGYPWKTTGSPPRRIGFSFNRAIRTTGLCVRNPASVPLLPLARLDLGPNALLIPASGQHGAGRV